MKLPTPHNPRRAACENEGGAATYDSQKRIRNPRNRGSSESRQKSDGAQEARLYMTWLTHTIWSDAIALDRFGRQTRGDGVRRIGRGEQEKAYSPQDVLGKASFEYQGKRSRLLLRRRQSVSWCTLRRRIGR